MTSWRCATVVLAAAGCAGTSPRPAFQDVAAAVAERSGHRVRWDEGTAKDVQVEHALAAMLRRDLSVDDAVQVALLRNPSLLATYEDLSIAQADLVQAGLLKNPVFGIAVAPSEHDTLEPPVIGSVAMDFLDLLTLPARKTIAETQLEGVKTRVGDAVLELAARVRSAYFAAQGSQQVVAMRRTIVEAADASLELAKRQRQAGNVNDLDLANEQALGERARLELARSEGEVLAAREQLTQLMGLWGEGTQWHVADRLPELPADEGPLAHLESLAIAQRLDVASQRRELETLSRTLSFVRSTRWTGAIQAQVEIDPLKDSQRNFSHLAVGPGVALALPLFDQGQAEVARVEAYLRQSQHRLDALAIEVRSQVRVARARVALARRIVEQFRATLVPLHERIVALSQQQYNAMLLGVYQLILARQNEVNIYREYIEAARDYWIARSDLERAVGGRVGPPATVSAPAAPPPAEPPMDHSKMHMQGSP